ncbi:MAG TPA: threonylcarbamoyl-AMP synthase [Sutterella sp.]|nr:threonylcarbamoyl-AMP synthase [Sutterella sp.]
MTDTPEVDPRAIRAACDVLASSGLVAMPTETVYGLAANADDEAAVLKIFAAKKRPKTHPLIVHVTGEDAFDAWAKDVPQAAYTLARTFWPGPLTMILKKSPRVGDWVTGGQDSVGLRAPSHPWARALISEFAGKNHRGIAAPSANTFGKVSPTTAQHVIDDLGAKPKGAVDLVLDGGSCDVGVESTILNLSGETPELLRHGAITRAMLESVLHVAIPDGTFASPRASGSFKSHYAPDTRVILTRDLAKTLSDLANTPVAVMAFEAPFKETPSNVKRWYTAPENASDYQRILYAQLHAMDLLDVKALIFEAPPETDAWSAVLDRLTRAAA